MMNKHFLNYKKARHIFTIIVLLLAVNMVLNAQTGLLHFSHLEGNLAKIAEDFGKQFKVQLSYVDEELVAVKVPAANYEAASIGELLDKVIAPGGFKATASGNSWIIRKIGGAPKQTLTMMLL